MNIGKRLESSQARFYHATCLRGFSAYCQAGGILSRREWKDRCPDYTKFWSDDVDEERGVLERVFGNVYDFDSIFARARFNSSPNVYGPITIVFAPSVFAELNDITLTKESIVKYDGNWRDHVLSESDVENMLEGDSYGHPIHKDFHYTEVSSGNTLIPFTQIQKIVVQPITFNGRQLQESVNKILDQFDLNHQVNTRSFGINENLEKYQNISDITYDLAVNGRDHKVTEEDFPDWIKDEKLKNRFIIWGEYLYHGTACYLRENEGI